MVRGSWFVGHPPPYNRRTQTVTAPDPAALTPGERSRPSPPWASADVAIGLAILAAGLWWDFGFTPEVLLLVALVSIGWRGPGWRVGGLRLPSPPTPPRPLGAARVAGHHTHGTVAG